jgi:hypothetical protein
MGEVYAELWIKIRSLFGMNEKKRERALNEWQQLIKSFQDQGIDVNDDTSSFASPEEVPPNEIWVGLGSGAKTEEPNYDAMYQLLGKFVQFLYEEALYRDLNIKLERTGASG